MDEEVDFNLGQRHWALILLDPQSCIQEQELRIYLTPKTYFWETRDGSSRRVSVCVFGVGVQLPLHHVRPFSSEYSLNKGTLHHCLIPGLSLSPHCPLGQPHVHTNHKVQAQLGVRTLVCA